MFAIFVFVFPKPQLLPLIKLGGDLKTIPRNENLVEKVHRYEDAWWKGVEKLDKVEKAEDEVEKGQNRR